MKKIIASIIILLSVTLCFSQTKKQVCIVKSDTLEIVSKEIKFIKVDGVVYEIKRTTTISKVEPTLTDIYRLSGGAIILDSIVDSRFYVDKWYYNLFYKN